VIDTSGFAPEEHAVEMKGLDALINSVDYVKLFATYIPSDFALQFITFIKLVNGSKGEENKSPLIHMHMLDQVVGHDENLFVSFRGSAKTTALHEYMFLYLATYGEIPGFGEVNVAIYVSDTIDNGVKNMRQNLEFRYNNSEFLQEYVPEARFTDVRWEFKNVSGKRFCCRGFGASTGVRGFKEYGQRPTWAGFDDLMSDKNAESPTIINDIKNIIYKAARQALHPDKRKILWTGTPFNARDPLYQAAESTSWNTQTYPICNQFPCTEEEFVGAWPDRFPYSFVRKEYNTLLGNGQVRAFNQELMLRIMSDEDRLIQDGDIRWYRLDSVVKNRHLYNFYITTDFAVSAEQSADYSVISVWAYSSVGDWFWVDGICVRQTMDKNISDLFRLVQEWRPQEVGVEVSGQQAGFVPWLEDMMLQKQIYFVMASENNSNKPGIRPTTNKMARFNIVVPWFKARKIGFPEEKRGSPELLEAYNELSLASPAGFKSKKDDFIDNISQLGSLKPWKPSNQGELMEQSEDGLWKLRHTPEEASPMSSYIV
jgi:phage terminase large subunit-like protein